ncbi:hypothetical protein FRC19_011995 [Serendipita sp. 401]|nr:hypothetical protein FRC19_011995 [Serendipita sp. 401]
MPVKMRRTGSKAASSTNIANKIHLAALTANPGDKESEKHLKRRTMSSQAIHQHQPSALTRTASQAKLHGNKTNGKHENYQNVAAARSAQGADDDDWVSSSSAMASPAPEPSTEEEDEAIYVNPNLNGRHSHHQTFPATPKRSNQQGLPHQRHHISDHETALDPKTDPLVPVTAAEYTRGIHPGPTVAAAATAHLPRKPQPLPEQNHIRFAGAPAQDDYYFNTPDPRIHRHGAAHHASPPPIVSPIGAAADDEGESDHPSTSVIRITEAPVSDLKTHKVNGANQVQGDEKQRDDGRSSRRTSARLRQDQIDAFVGQIAPVSTMRPAVSGNGGGGASNSVGQEVGRISQRGLGAASVQTTQPLTPVAPDASNSQPPPVARNRPSMLRRDTTPTAVSRSPIPVDTPPRSQTPPASMTHDEMVALNHKRHSVHSAGGNRRPLSLFQPSLSTKRHSIAQHGHPTPLSLLVRMNTTQGGNHALAAPPAISPSYDRDGDAGYVSMSPTRSRAGQSLRRRGSVASLSSIATAPVTTSTSSATAQGSAASPTSAMPTTSSALLHNLHSKPTKHLSMTSRHDIRPEIRRTSQLYYKSDESPLFVSQFCAKKDPRSDRDGNSRSLGEEMAGPEDWSSHLTIMRYRHPMLESMHRISAAKAEASRLK